MGGTRGTRPRSLLGTPCCPEPQTDGQSPHATAQLDVFSTVHYRARAWNWAAPISKERRANGPHGRSARGVGASAKESEHPFSPTASASSRATDERDARRGSGPGSTTTQRSHSNRLALAMARAPDPLSLQTEVPQPRIPLCRFRPCARSERPHRPKACRESKTNRHTGFSQRPIRGTPRSSKTSSAL